MPRLSALDYLFSFRDPTAQRLISPTIQKFIRDDLKRGGVLTGTLSNLNVTAMSKRLYIHTNTSITDCTRSPSKPDSTCASSRTCSSSWWRFDWPSR